MKKIVQSTLLSASLLAGTVGVLSSIEVGKTMSETSQSIEMILQGDKDVDFFREHYGLSISFVGSSILNNIYQVEFVPTSEQEDVLNRLCDEVLRYYPHRFIKRAYIRNVYLVKNIQDKDGNIVGGFELNGNMYVNISGNNLLLFHHELFHRYDNKDRSDNNSEWKNNFHNADAIQGKDFSSSMGEAVLGYADQYGATHGIDEDQATIIEYLTNPEKFSTLQDRFDTDTTLLDKVQILTGCVYSLEEKRFVRELSLEEYQELSGYEGFEFYRKWSHQLMGVGFWNQISQGDN